MNSFFSPMQELEDFKHISSLIQNSSGENFGINGPSTSQKAHLVMALLTALNKKAIFVAHNELHARKFYEDFSFFDKENVLFLPYVELVLHDIAAESFDVHFERMAVLSRLYSGDFRVIVTSSEALLRKFMNPQRFKEASISVNMGGILDPMELSYQLTYMGYERVAVVEGKGQFALRGGILDIFPVQSKKALRIELFGDEVNSIRNFETTTQRSLQNVDSGLIIPAKEVLYFPEEREPMITRIMEEMEATLKKRKDGNTVAAERLEKRVECDVERLQNEYYFAGMEKYNSFFPQSGASFLDYCSQDTLLFVEEPQKLGVKIETSLFEHYDNCRDMLEKGFVLPSSHDALLSKDALYSCMNKKGMIFLTTLGVYGDAFSVSETVTLAVKPVSSFHGKLDMFFDEIKHHLQKKKKVVLLGGAKAKCQKFSEVMTQNDIPAKFYENPDFSPQEGIVSITHGTLTEGFEYIQNGFVLIADRELFGEDKRAAKDRFKGNNSKKINVFAEIEPGDYVVHYSHGIGQYIGIEKLSVEGSFSDYLKIKYIDGASLYVPVTQLDLVQKYIGSADKAPKLNRLGSSEWGKAKSKVKESLRDVALGLTVIYAQREASKGHQFSPDTVWQKQMEDMFPYEETADQIKCIDEIKRDMESDRPMDRLLCGDVGFGKTEVAIRAMFKAVMEGKQVAYLVPTTVLAYQHYMNFKDRFKDFPVTIEMLSRFKTEGEQNKIVTNLKKGMVDIVVGTHRVVQKDIKFKDLGLLVVDEEQRFGVAHKEQLKRLKANVDVLTLTATPIPRTLHMSMIGIRDISVIEEAPHDRHPVQTYVVEHNEDMIREAIEREISRRGQIFYLFNTIRTIELKMEEIQRIVPDAKIEIAHGQMSKNRLEEVMQDFLDKKFDVLLCSTIIESGLDYPNVNTIIVEDADRLGLSQLYQIRGRVGRSNRIAYAYLMFKRDKILSDVADKRLQAIREFTELGSGFKIAMRDLEIRGSGNILGAQQHGHMDSVGYDMYMRLLDEAVKELRGNLGEAVEAVEVKVDFNLNAFISGDYIPNEIQKLNMYKKIATIESEEDYSDLLDELMDRFGNIPEETKNLVDIAYLRSVTRGTSIESLSQKGDKIMIQFLEGSKVDFGMLALLIEKNKKRVMFNASSKPYITYNTQDLGKEEMLANVKFLLQDIKNSQKNLNLGYN